ncbi:hypothetical protein C6370_15470 [Bacillus atrophaeus]|nr:hypothetical protein C6370_15470 [Bacillus atrophaeus]
MGERCLELADEFESKGIDKCFYYNKTNLHKLDIYEILRVIKGNPRFKFSNIENTKNMAGSCIIVG